jgi:hypothetical protein
MSDYLFCTSNPDQPGCIQIRTSLDDPRLDTLDAKLRRREMGIHTLEWTLPVVDRGLSEAALIKVMRPYRSKSDKASFACNPMTARAEAVRLTTLRPDPRNRKKPGLLRRLARAI